MLAWSGKPALGATSLLFLRRYDAEGQPVGQQFVKGSSFGVASPLINALRDGSLVMAWNESIDSQEKSLFLEHFDAATNPLNQPQGIGAARTTGALQFGAAVTGEGNVGLAWASPPAGQPRSTFTGQIVDANGSPVTAPVTSTPAVTTAQSQQFDVLLLTTRSTGFNIFVQAFFGFNRGAFERLGVVPVASDGTLGGYTQVTQSPISSFSDISGATTGPAAWGFGVAAGNDDHFITAYEGGVSGGANAQAESH